MRLRCSFLSLLLLAPGAVAQFVISAQAGLIERAEGDVLLNGTAIHWVNGRFPQMTNESLLSTKAGKAELVLSPYALLWLGNNSSIRMVQNNVADARIEVVNGSVVIETSEVPPDARLTILTADGSEIRAASRTFYRMDEPSSELTVFKGEISVLALAHNPAQIPQQHIYNIGSAAITLLPGSRQADELDRWATERRVAIATSMSNTGELPPPQPKGKGLRHRVRLPFPAAASPFPGRVR